MSTELFSSVIKVFLCSRVTREWLWFLLLSLCCCRCSAVLRCFAASQQCHFVWLARQAAQVSLGSLCSGCYFNLSSLGTLSICLVCVSLANVQQAVGNPSFHCHCIHMGKKYLQQRFDILSKALSTTAGFLWMRGVSVAMHKELASLVVKCWTRWILLFWPHLPLCSPPSASTVTAKSHRNWADSSSNRLWSLWQESFNLPLSKERRSPDKLQMALEPLIFLTLPQRCGFVQGGLACCLSVWYSSKHGSC